VLDPVNVNGTDQTFNFHSFVAKLNTSGALVYATYITGSCGESAYGLTLDSSGAAYVVGETYSHDFPLTPDSMVYEFPGTTSSGFVARLSPAGDQLLYGSYLGSGALTAAHAITLDGTGNIYVAGSTYASPTKGAWQAVSFVNGGVGCNTAPLPVGPPQIYAPIGNAFVLKMTPSVSPAAFLATVGGSCQGEADSIALDAAGNIWLAGFNGSVDFVTRAPIGGLGQPNGQQLGPVIFPSSNPVSSGFVAELDPTGSTLLSATLTYYLGALAADSTAVYFAGPLGSAALVAEIDPTQIPPIAVDEIVQYSPLLTPLQRAPSPVAPGEIVRILGRGIGPQNQVGAKLTATGTFATSIGGVQVAFNGVPAPLLSAQANQIVCIAPFELDGLQSAVVQVQYGGQTSNAYPVGVLPQNPDIVAVVNSDWSVNSQSNPAKRGSPVVLFLTGLGQTTPASSDGAINQLPPAQPRTVPAVKFWGPSGNVIFIGAAPFEVAGVSQLNLIAPVVQTAQGWLGVWVDQALAYVWVAQ
jgi:uncharacterized protein (TIGR03437 family)